MNTNESEIVLWAGERRKNTSTLADTDVLLDVLGNETRRRILDLIYMNLCILTNWPKRCGQVNSNPAPCEDFGRHQFDPLFLY